MTVDLHIHTTASDGRLSPTQVVQLAARRGLSVIAITDHDSTEGIAPALTAAQAFPNLRIIPGIELSTDMPQGEIHVLGYFIDYHNQRLQRRLEGIRSSRLIRAQRILTKLAKMGVHLQWERVLELAGGGSVGRPHIAQAMLEREYISSLQEAFVKYIGRHGPAYAQREKLTPLEAVELVVSTKGLPVLAHPADIQDLDALLQQLTKAGLVGLEAYYDGYSSPVIDRLLGVANHYQLIPCGGSDYHGLEDDPTRELGHPPVPPDCAYRLISLAEERSAEVATR